MALIKNCEIWFLKADPARPNPKFNKDNPTWECQLRTTSKEQKKAWEALNLAVKDFLPDEGEPYYRVNLKKKSIKADGEAASAVDVINGELKPIDPNSVGNGSLANVRVFQYEYTNKGKKGVASVLMAIQVVRHIVYVPKPRDDDFDQAPTETVDAPLSDVVGDDDIPF